MVRDGRSLKSLIGRHAADMQIVGYAGFIDILDGMADAFLDAIRVGVPVRMLPGQSVFGTTRNMTTVDVRTEKLSALNAALAAAKREAESARTMAVKANAKNNAELEAEYDLMADRRTADVVRLRKAVADLRAEPAEVVVNEPFDVRADVWVRALSRLKSCQGSMTQQERVAFQMIFPKFRMELVQGTWWAVASMRLNTVDGVAELGPVRWPVNTQGRSTVLALNRPATATGERRTRHEIVSTLVGSGRMCRDAAQTVTNAPFRELRYLLLHEVCGEPLPDWVGEQWRDRVFVDWIVTVYTDPDWSWSGRGKYGSSLLVRQFAVWVVAQHGLISGRQLRRVMGPGAVIFKHLVAPFADKNTRQRPIQPCLTDAGKDENGYQLLAPIVCECGEPATTVARAPEMLTDLLCDCRQAPGGEALGMPPGLRFPDDYHQMRLSLKQCQDLMSAKRAKRRATLTKRERVVLGRADLFVGGISATRLAGELGLGSLHETMLSLQSRGLIEVTGRHNFTLWHLTADGERFVEQMG
ncbi:hypothetical protein [Aeromicrobium sp. 9AM]|uniref:hypothetical protein n=1 Tax=Aeromicrobium sp. 9AM TaxID=2653126 RepID=UPI0012EFD3C7|nr:hypothetical protein [Aeromicrobium sp. 9AM]VXB06041.1 conserved hypothetical protein [Aeromicrobium sp. 9AM]